MRSESEKRGKHKQLSFINSNRKLSEWKPKTLKSWLPDVERRKLSELSSSLGKINE